MPLSEHEQRQLEQIEQTLCADDPRFARRMTGIATGHVPAKDRQAGKQAGTGLMARLEERWRRRRGATAKLRAARCQAPPAHSHVP